MGHLESNFRKYSHESHDESLFLAKISSSETQWHLINNLVKMSLGCIKYSVVPHISSTGPWHPKWVTLKVVPLTFPSVYSFCLFRYQILKHQPMFGSSPLIPFFTHLTSTSHHTVFRSYFLSTYWFKNLFWSTQIKFPLHTVIWVALV